MAQQPAPPASFLEAVPERRQKDWIREFVNLTDWFVAHPSWSYLARDGMLNQKQVGVSELLWPKTTTQGELCKWLNWAAVKVYGKRGSSEKPLPSIWVPAERGVGLTKRYQRERHLLQVPDELPRAVFLQSVAEQLTLEQPVLLASTCCVWPDAIDAVAFLGLIARAVQAVLIAHGQSQPCEEQAAGARLFVARARPKCLELSPLAKELLAATESPSLSHWLQRPDAPFLRRALQMLVHGPWLEHALMLRNTRQRGQEGQAAADVSSPNLGQPSQECQAAAADVSSRNLGRPSQEGQQASGPTNPAVPTHWWQPGASTLLQWQLDARPVFAPPPVSAVGLRCPGSLAEGAAAEVEPGSPSQEGRAAAAADASRPNLGSPPHPAEQDLGSGPANPTVPTHWWVVSVPVPHAGSTFLQWQLVARPVLAPGLRCPGSLAAGTAAQEEVDVHTTAPVSSCGASTPSKIILLSAASSSASGSSGRGSPASCDTEDEDSGHPLGALESVSALRQQLEELQRYQDSASDGASRTSDDEDEVEHADSSRTPNAFAAPAPQAFFDTQLGWLHAAAWHASYAHWCRTHSQEVQLPVHGNASKTYKTQLCRHHEAGFCRDGDQCTFAHGDGELRKLLVPPARAYRTQLCRHHAAGTCRHGESCNFAHGEEELQSYQNHPAYKTQLCRHHAAGTCSNGASCTFAHGEEELPRWRSTATE